MGSERREVRCLAGLFSTKTTLTRKPKLLAIGFQGSGGIVWGTRTTRPSLMRNEPFSAVSADPINAFVFRRTGLYSRPRPASRSNRARIPLSLHHADVRKVP